MSRLSRVGCIEAVGEGGDARGDAEVGVMVKASARETTPQLLRCPACGQRVDPESPTRCALCDFEFGDDRVTGADVTPYARAFARGEPGWRRMGEWVWFAGIGRLNHLALMRASAASRRFALVNLMLLSACLGLYQLTRVGWRWESGDSSAVLRPTGQGWLRVGASSPSPVAESTASEFTTLWWSLPQGVIVLVTASVAALLSLLVLMLLLRTGLTKAHTSPYRHEQRMTAALHYSTAWVAPVLIAAAIVALKPIAYVGHVRGWSLIPPSQGFDLSAATVAGIGAAMWWFWLVRLGATAPTPTRAQVVAFIGLVVPLFVFVVGAGWWMGLNALFPRLFSVLDLSF